MVCGPLRIMFSWRYWWYWYFIFSFDLSRYSSKQIAPSILQVTEKENSGGTSSAVKTEGEDKKDVDQDFHMSDEQVNVSLDCTGGQLKQLKRKYIR